MTINDEYVSDFFATTSKGIFTKITILIPSHSLGVMTLMTLSSLGVSSTKCQVMDSRNQQVGHEM